LKTQKKLGGASFRFAHALGANRCAGSAVGRTSEYIPLYYQKRKLCAMIFYATRGESEKNARKAKNLVDSAGLL